MPNIPYPNVPNFPGVPSLVRSSLSNPEVNFALGTLGNLLLNALQSGIQWGIFNVNGTQLAGTNELTLIKSLVIQPTVQSFVGMDYRKEWRVSEFQLQSGSFATYNKVEMSAEPVVELALTGFLPARTAFIKAIQIAAGSLDLFNIVTPEFVYSNYTISSISYPRRAAKGATMITIQLTLKEIREVSATFTTSQNTISNPANPSATSAENTGKVQPAAPDVSTFKSLFTKFSALAGAQ